jgi:predicted nuclease with TOPRIM domain
MHLQSYIRDLEAKLKTIDETKESANISTADLKKEIARLRDVEAHSVQHIADLELRLSKSDENVLSLRASVEQLEEDIASRQTQVEDLQKRMDILTADSDEWRASLEAREARVSELEEKLKEWEVKKEAAAEDRERLGNLVDGVAKARQSLDIEVARVMHGTPGETKTDAPADAVQTKEQSDLQVQFVALQETHTATLADLSAVTAKYRDALREISDLAAQIAEAKLNSPPDSGPISDSPAPAYDTASLGRRRGLQRRQTGESIDSVGSAGSASSRRLFFRQAASVESLHARSLSPSQSLSQELSSARTPKLSLTGNPNGLGSPQIGSATTPKLSLLVPPSTSGTLTPSPSTPTDGRTVQSLEKEIMRLQEVLKERETEIGALETTLKELKNPAPKKTALHDVEENDEEEMLEMSSQSGVERGKLSPTTLGKFAKLRRSLIIEHPPRFDDGPSAESETLDRLNELMRCVPIYDSGPSILTNLCT